MKTKTSVKTRCEHCYTVKREGVLFVYCKKNRRHNQKQWRGFAKNIKKSKKARG
jgi:large subunit ribosomal protein L36